MDVPHQYKDAQRFAFGDNPALADSLLALVLAGSKTATCGDLREFGGEGQEPLPVVGAPSIVLDGAGQPRCVIETTELVIRRFDEVPEDFALAEGEGDYAEWREGHVAYFSRNRGWSEDMQVVCERFRVVEVLGAPQENTAASERQNG